MTAAPAAHTLFVSPAGDDAWSGRFADPAPDRADGPLATLAAARDRLRADRAAARISGPAAVFIRAGVYPLHAPLRFDTRDSATTYAAYEAEQPVFTGAVRITDWTTATLNGRRCWHASAAAWLAHRAPVHSLFVNGLRAPRPRLPKQGCFHPDAIPNLPEKEDLYPGPDRLAIPAGILPDHPRNLRDIHLRVLHLWIDERMPLASYDPQTRLVTSTNRSVAGIRPGDSSWLRGRCFFENVFEAFTEPGQWYLDRTSSTLYYLPREGETPDTAEVLLPLALQFLVLDGATHLRFHGLTFRHSDWVQPVDDWGTRFDPYAPRDQWPPRDSFSHFIDNNGIDPRQTWGSVPQAAFNVPGVLRLTGCSHCAIQDCTIEHIGFYGIELADGCRSNRIVGNTIRDCGAGGINMDGGGLGADPGRRTHSNRVTDNRIESCGRVFYAACGIWLGHTYDNYIAHNEIADLRYTGISVGWQWTRDPHVSRGNIVEKNHIHHIGGPEVLSDLAGIYTLGIQPGTILRGNVIHDIGCDAYGAWGIYCDASSAHIITENNLIYATQSECLNNNTGNNENLHRNNVLIGAAKGTVGCGRRLSDWPADPMLGSAMTFHRNIVITRTGHAFRLRPGHTAGEIVQSRMILSESNLFWDTDARSAPTPVQDWNGKTLFTWDTWRQAGHDRTSVAADPLFIDPANHDYRLSPDSPALKLGFAPINFTDVGPRPRGTDASPVKKQTKETTP